MGVGEREVVEAGRELREHATLTRAEVHHRHVSRAGFGDHEATLVVEFHRAGRKDVVDGDARGARVGLDRQHSMSRNLR